MLNAALVPPAPHNEPVFSYAPGSPERAVLEAALRDVAGEERELPMFIGGREVRTGDLGEVRMPHDHRHRLATFHRGGAVETQAAIAAAREASPSWSRMPYTSRLAIFLRAAELLATRRRAAVNAATMLGQSKTCYQSELDAACELIDFLRYNCWYASQIYREQPASSTGMWNASEARPLEGFVFAVSPFNFTAIGGNLPTAPALLGNTVVWKPAPTAMLSNYKVLEVLREAGLPDGVINLVQGDPRPIGDTALGSPHLAGIHFTGSTAVFQWMWRTVGERIASYRTYPRLVGETGGKDFIVAHESADLEALATAIVRGGFEFQGQKCSAASRIYIPDTLWPRLSSLLREMIAAIPMGDVADFKNFMGAVIDERSFDRIGGYLEIAKESATVLAGGGADKKKGWFVEPTLVRVDDPAHVLLREEIFGPVVTAYVYPAKRFAETLALVDQTSPYGLTGSIFARDRDAVDQALSTLRDAAGNFYINDKPTGAVVGQQPFGGARASGTNDKAGSALNLQRWVSMRTIKETLVPPTSWRHPHMG